MQLQCVYCVFVSTAPCLFTVEYLSLRKCNLWIYVQEKRHDVRGVGIMGKHPTRLWSGGDGAMGSEGVAQYIQLLSLLRKLHLVAQGNCLCVCVCTRMCLYERQETQKVGQSGHWYVKIHTTKTQVKLFVCMCLLRKTLVFFNLGPVFFCLREWWRKLFLSLLQF